MEPERVLSGDQRHFLAAARRGTLATIDPAGLPRLVPICFVLGQADDASGRPCLYTPLDEKPKASTDPHRLARVRDLLVRPAATVLVDRWDEDWARLAWLRVYGHAEILEPPPASPEAAEHAAAIVALRAKYEQYRTQRLEDRPIIRLTIDRARSWGILD